MEDVARESVAKILKETLQELSNPWTNNRGNSRKVYSEIFVGTSDGKSRDTSEKITEFLEIFKVILTGTY